MFMPEANDVPELVDDDAKLIAVVADRNRLRTVAPFPDERATTARPDLMKRSKAGYRVTLVACRWAGAVIEKDNGALGRSSELKTLKNAENINSRKSVRWSAVPALCQSELWLKLRGEQGSGPEGVDDLCFHTYGGFSPPPPPPLKSQSRGPNSSLEAQISVLRPKSQPQGPNPSLKAKILAWRL